MNIDNYIPSVSIDCVLFGFHNNELKVLLLKMKGMSRWALPGGFLEADQDLEAGAKAVLKNRTGLDNIFLQQFHVFGKVNRSQYDADDKEPFFEEQNVTESLQNWLNQRFISIGYYALVEYSKVEEPIPDIFSEVCEWKPFNDLPNMMLDHQEILNKAYEALKQGLQFQPIGLKLLPEEFTMPELRALYETILNKKLDRRNFRRKILSLDILDDTNKVRMGQQNKAPIIYKFNLKKYEAAVKNQFNTKLF